jgi:hypothetical protein
MTPFRLLQDSLPCQLLNSNGRIRRIGSEATSICFSPRRRGTEFLRPLKALEFPSSLAISRSAFLAIFSKFEAPSFTIVSPVLQSLSNLASVRTQHGPSIKIVNLKHWIGRQINHNVAVLGSWNSAGCRIEETKVSEGQGTRELSVDITLDL